MAKGELKKGTVVRNTGWLLVGNIARMIIQLIIGAISARYLGPSNYGTLNYVNAYINLFAVICELGLTITIVNEIVRKPKDDGKLLGTAITLRLIASFVSVCCLQIIVSFTDRGDNIVKFVTLIRSIGIVFESFNSINGWYQSKLQSKYTAIIEVIAYIVSSVYKVYILATGKDIYWFAAATTIDLLCIAVLYLFAYHKHGTNTFKFSGHIAKTLLKQGLPFILSGIMLFIYGQTDRIMLGKMLDQTAVGYYSCAATISSLIGFIPQAIMNSGKTIIMEAKKEENQHLFELRTEQTIAAVFWFMFIYALGIFILGKFVIYVLFGEKYYEAIPALRILIWSSGFSYIGTIRNIWLISEGKNRYAVVFSSIGATLNIVLNFLLIPRIGISGASIATVFTQIFATLLLPYLFPATRNFGVIFGRAIILRDINLRELTRMIRDKVTRK